MPSFWSWLSNSNWKALRSSARAWSSGRSAPARTTSLICASASGGRPAIWRASSRARSNAWPSAATSLTNPMARASGASTVQPVNSMRSA